MDSQAGTLAGNICNNNPPHLSQSVHTAAQRSSETDFREVFISSVEIADRSAGMGVAGEPLQCETLVGRSQEQQHDSQRVNGIDEGTIARTTGDCLVNESVLNSNKTAASSDTQSVTATMEDVSLNSSAAGDELLTSASTDVTTDKSCAKSTISPSSNPVQRSNKLCNRTSNSLDTQDNTENCGNEAVDGSCHAKGSHLAMSSQQDAIGLEPDLPRECDERTPGEERDVPTDTNPDQGFGTTSIASAQSGESSQEQPAVLDVTSSGELILSDTDLSSGDGEIPTSPATIDVVNLGSQSPIGSKLRRPRSLEGCLDFDNRPPKWSTPNKSQSLRTTPSTSTPRFLEELNAAGTTVIELQEPTVEPLQDWQSDSRNPRLSGILQHELRSRASFTSVSSLSTDYSSSLATDDLSEYRDNLEPGFVEVNLHSQLSAGDHWAYTTQGAKPKKKGLAGFLARNLFPWKSSAKSSVDQADSPPASTGWKLFNRTPAKHAAQHQNPYDSNFPPKGKTHPPTLSLNWKKKQAGMRPATSTTALILENRPQHLPAKNPDEEQKHKEQYEQMVKGAKQKEIKVYKQQMKKLAKQLKYEEGIKTLLHVWQTDILKNWEQSKTSKKTREMWWQGIPPSIRGRVWVLAIGNELNITPELFEIFLARAKDRIKVFSEPDTEDAEEVHEASREDSVDVIRLDVSRTFPHLCIYQKGGPYFDRLHSVLGAYACYRPDIGYVQGMSFIAAVFLLYLEPADAFCCFANVLNKSCQLAFFRLNQPVMQSYFDTYEEYFEDNLPDLYNHFKSQCLTPDLYIIDWMYTLYTKSLPLDVACRFLDIFFRDGEEFIFRTALGILHLYEEILISLEFIQLAQFLTKLPEDIQCDQLFKSIEVIDMHQKKFSQVLAAHLANNSHS